MVWQSPPSSPGLVVVVVATACPRSNPFTLFSLFSTSLAARCQSRSFVLLSVPLPLFTWTSCYSRSIVTFSFHFSLRLLHEPMGRRSFRGVPASECLRKNCPAPSNVLVKDFLRWYFKSRAGRLDEKPNIKCIRN